MTPVTVPVRPPAPVSAPPAMPLGAVAWGTMSAAVASGSPVTPVRPAASPGSAAAGWLATGDPGPGRTAPGDLRRAGRALPVAAAARAGGVLLGGPATVLETVRATVRATVPVTVLVTVPATVLVAAGTTLAAAAEGAAGSDWLWGCDPADWPGAEGPPLCVTLWTVWLTLVSAPPPAGTVLEPPDPPGKMSWVTPLTAAPPGRWWPGRGLVRGAAGPGSGLRRNAGRGSGRRGGSAGGGCLAPAPTGPQNWAGPQRQAGPTAAVLGAGPRRTAPGCHCPVRGCCPARGGDSGPRQPPSRPRKSRCRLTSPPCARWCSRMWRSQGSARSLDSALRPGSGRRTPARPGAQQKQALRPNHRTHTDKPSRPASRPVRGSQTPPRRTRYPRCRQL